MMNAIKYLAGYETFVSDSCDGIYWIPERLINKIQRLWQRLTVVENRGDS